MKKKGPAKKNGGVIEQEAVKDYDTRKKREEKKTGGELIVQKI